MIAAAERNIRSIMAKKKTIDIVSEILTPFLEKEGYCLYHMEFAKESKDWYLRVFIEKKPEEGQEWPGNVDTDDCEKVSRYLSDELDRLDPIEQNYYLEVSSPGMDRQLLKKQDFIRYKGQLIDVKLYEGIRGKKAMTGKLSVSSESSITIEDEKGNVLDIPMEKISKINLTVVF
ncbi:ribosome maturation factor RimP [Bacillota bacterium]